MKFWVIEPVGGHGGMNYYNNGLGEGILANGGEIVLFTCDETREVSKDRFEILKVFRGIYGPTNKLVRAARFFKGLAHTILLIKRGGGSLCHLHFFQYGLLELMSCISLRAAGIKVIATVHDVEAFGSNNSRFSKWAVFNLCSELIVHNNFSKNELNNNLITIGIRKPIAVIPHGNYIPFIKKNSKTASRKRIGIDDETSLVLFFGQIKKVKGLDILIEAIPRVLERRPNTTFLIAGKVWKDSFEKYQSLIESNGVGSSVVQHIRYIPDEHVDDYYCSADVVVLPYRKIYQSGVLIMAMSYGCCTISSGLEAMKEIIKDGINGYLFSPESSISLSEKIVFALDSDRNSISRAALETVKSSHDWAFVGKKHIEAYRRNA